MIRLSNSNKGRSLFKRLGTIVEMSKVLLRPVSGHIPDI